MNRCGRWLGVGGLALAGLLTGCVQSYHPFCTSESLAPVAELAGEWDVVKPVGDGNLAASTNRPWVCTVIQTGLYEVVTFGTNEIPGTILVATFKVGNQLYVDTTAGEPGDRPSNPFWDSSIARVHNLWQAHLSNDVLSLQALSLDWLRNAGKSNLVTLAFASEDDSNQGGRLYTARPAEWIQFLAKFGTQAGVFDDEPAFVLRKRKPATPPAPAPAPATPAAPTPAPAPAAAAKPATP
jgi:hypothetical protein